MPVKDSDSVLSRVGLIVEIEDLVAFLRRARVAGRRGPRIVASRIVEPRRRLVLAPEAWWRVTLDVFDAVDVGLETRDAAFRHRHPDGIGRIGGILTGCVLRRWLGLLVRPPLLARLSANAAAACSASVLPGGRPRSVAPLLAGAVESPVRTARTVLTRLRRTGGGPGPRAPGVPRTWPGS